MGIVHELEQERVRLCGKSCMQHCVLDSIQKSHFCSGALPQTKSEWNKWKYFNETKGDVGMSRHEKEREQEDAYTKTQSHSQPHPYIFVFLTHFMS